MSKYFNTSPRQRQTDLVFTGFQKLCGHALCCHVLCTQTSICLDKNVSALFLESLKRQTAVILVLSQIMVEDERGN